MKVPTKGNTDNWTTILSVESKDAMKGMKRQPIEWECIFAIQKGLLSKV